MQGLGAKNVNVQLSEWRAAITFQLQLMGGFVLQSRAGTELTIPSRKGQALFAILALAAGRPVSRERIIGLLWSDRGEQQARSSLRQALTELRKILPDLAAPLLITDRQTAHIDPDAFEIDAIAFERLIDEGTGASLAAAADLYRGDLLDGLDVRDAGFEAWLRVERQQLRDQAGKAFRRLLEQQSGSEAIATAQRLLRFDPLDEVTHRELMRLFAKAGDRSAAIKQYEACRQSLQAELQLEPDSETERVLERIRRGEIGREASGAHPSSAAATVDLPLPDMPSIAVLPFANLSGDPEQEYFVDGMAEDIVTTLSKIPGLLVVARRSTSVYKGAEVDVRRVGQEQGVSHVLAGSLRKSGDRIRVTAQLIDAATGSHQWAERYDRELDDVFEVQDEITKNVTTELQVHLARGEEARVWARGTSNIEAWEMVARAMPLSDDHIKEHNAEAQSLASAAVGLDPNYASAWVILGWTHWEDSLWGWSRSHEISMKTAQSCVERALACDPASPEAMVLLSNIHMANRDTGKAIALGRKAVALAPSHASNVALVAMAMIFGGEPESGLTLMKRAKRLCPIYPQWYHMMLGVVHHMSGEHDEAAEIFRECLAKEPETSLHRLWLASALIETEQDEEAKLLAAEVLEIEPGFKASSWAEGFRADDYLTNLLLTNLTRAGLPK